jgi:hypothetical protein
VKASESSESDSDEKREREKTRDNSCLRQLFLSTKLEEVGKRKESPFLSFEILNIHTYIRMYSTYEWYYNDNKKGKKKYPTELKTGCETVVAVSRVDVIRTSITCENPFLATTSRVTLAKPLASTAYTLAAPA